MGYLSYILVVVAVWAAVYLLYLGLSKGLSASARHQQASRFAIASVLAVAPFAVAGVERSDIPLGAIVALSALWCLTYPVIDLFSRRAHATEIDNKMDFAFGLYLCSLLSALWLALQALWPGNAVAGAFMAAVEIPLAWIPLGQIVYAAIYGRGVDHDGLRLVMNTYPSEVWEYLRSFPLWASLVGVLGCLGFTALWFVWDIGAATPVAAGWWRPALLLLLAAVAAAIAFRGEHSPWRRAGVLTLWFDNLEYIRLNRLYASRAGERMRSFGKLTPRASHRPRTFVLVIGESASREYMSAFTPQPGEVDNTPWLSALAAGAEAPAVLFTDAYSCHFQTVPTLTSALTASNQKVPVKFHRAPSVVDAAHALGMKVWWYSNQSHIGANDTPVSLMAESADDCAWTRLALNRIPYDEALLDFLPRVTPDTDNLLVLHLKGSHFNYESRYPAEMALYPPAPGKEGYEAHYRNSLAYTDRVLAQVYDYCRANLNLAAMIYCSDHADIPTSRRSPVFNGVACLKIPLFVALSPGYAAENPSLLRGLRSMAPHLFVNDFLYDLTLAVLSPAQFPLPTLTPPLFSLLGSLPLPSDS